MSLRRCSLLVVASLAPLLPCCVGDDPGGGTPMTSPDAAPDVIVTPPDAGTREDASSTDAATPPACDMAKPFAPPVLLDVPGSFTSLSSPRLSADELTLYFMASGGDGGPGGVDLYRTTRSSKTSPFGPSVLVPNQSSADDDAHPMLSADGLTFFFTSSRPGVGGFDLYVATRPNAASELGTPGLLAGANGNVTDTYPFLRADGKELFFVSNRPGTGPNVNLDIYRAAFDGSTVSGVTRVDELSSLSNEFSPVLSADGLTVFFSSDRTDGGSKGGTEIWTAKRPSLSTPFEGMAIVSELNTAGDEEPGWLSPDGCRMYLFSTASGPPRIYTATRP